MLTKTKNFEKQTKKLSGDMVDRYLSPKIAVDPLQGFRENDSMGGWMTDGQRTPTS